jgi:hypothetical protein
VIFTIGDLRFTIYKKMKCENIQFNLSLYADDVLSEKDRAAVDEHLAQCPLCRQKRDDYQALRQTLRQMLPPTAVVMPKDLLSSVKNAMAELEPTAPQRKRIFSAGFREFLQMRVMPLTVGTAASLFFGFSLLWILLSGIGSQQNQKFAQYEPTRTDVLIANARPTSNLQDGEITPLDLVSDRLSVSSESPSVNPQGALVALTKSLAGGKMKDDEVVVVADVFSNGLANIEEVVEPLDNEQAVYELEKALEKNSSGAPFVPAFLDKRADSVRVVLKIQRVEVKTSQPKPRRR